MKWGRVSVARYLPRVTALRARTYVRQLGCDASCNDCVVVSCNKCYVVVSIHKNDPISTESSRVKTISLLRLSSLIRPQTIIADPISDLRPAIGSGYKAKNDLGTARRHFSNIPINAQNHFKRLLALFPKSNRSVSEIQFAQILVEAPGSAPGSNPLIPNCVYHHSYRSNPTIIG